MPYGDGTGPLGQGPMTGRGLGFCRGFRRCWAAQSGYKKTVKLTSEEEKKILKEELKDLDLEKKEIEERLKEL